MKSESCTVLRLGVMRKLAMCCLQFFFYFHVAMEYRINIFQDTAVQQLVFIEGVRGYKGPLVVVKHMGLTRTLVNFTLMALCLLSLYI